MTNKIRDKDIEDICERLRDNARHLEEAGKNLRPYMVALERQAADIIEHLQTGRVHLWKTVHELIADLDAARQQEAEPVAWILTGTDRDLVPRRYLLFSGREAELHVAQNLAGGEWQSCAAKPLYLHPPKPAAQTDGWDAEAYKSACDGLEHWRARAEEAEKALERIRHDLSPTHMGEPVIPQWAGWACQYPGKLPRLYGAREIAEVNCDRENGDTLIYLQSSVAHQVDDRPVIDCKHCGGFGEITGEYPGVVCPVCNGACVDAPAAVPQVPEGYQLVPTTLSDAMRDAFVSYRDGESACNCYAALLSAATEES